MCGIIGIIAERMASDELIRGLRRLEYRGYDSAGVATLEEGKIERRRKKGKIKELEKVLEEQPLTGTIGIGHTRWATHGAPVTENAHPHSTDKVAVVHNGIIENFADIREELESRGHVFATETDTEVIPHLITEFLNDGMKPMEAVQAAIVRLEGAYALGVLFADHNDILVAARKGSPLVIGYGGGDTNGEMYLGSDAVALAGLAKSITYLDDHDVALLHRNGSAEIRDINNEVVKREKVLSNVTALSIGKENYRHFMLKEIYEQPSVIGNILHSYSHLLSGDIRLPSMPFDPKKINRITVIACGTSYYAGAIAKYWCEQMARVPVDIDVASEFRYRKPVFADREGYVNVAVFISQSGETADTLAAMRYAKEQGCYTIAVVNVTESTMAREADVVMPIYCGPEIGVASTKAFTAQLCVLACTVITLARAGEKISKEEARKLGHNLSELPACMMEALKLNDAIQTIANEVSAATSMIYVGRGTSFAVAQEGALKLKEISYIHAESVAAGELKHGPIALVDEHVPIIAVAPRDELFEKTASNIYEIHARGGKIILVGDKEACEELKDVAWRTIEMPSCYVPFTSPLLYAIPMQLLAYHVAVHKGTDVDQPRNLAKSVTVE